MTRRDARRHAFMLVFQLPFRKEFNTETLASAKKHFYEYLAETDENIRLRSKNAAYIDRAVWGVFERQNQIDQVITNFLREWDIDRICKIDLAVMRLAIYEMLCEPDVTPGVAVNEAVEIAKEYGTDDSQAFVNGVLGNISRSLPKSDQSIDFSRTPPKHTKALLDSETFSHMPTNFPESLTEKSNG